MTERWKVPDIKKPETHKTVVEMYGPLSRKQAPIIARFYNFHLTNPKVFEIVLDITREMYASGWSNASMSLIFERIRWLYSVRTKGDKYKLNNDYRAFYARSVMKYDPCLDGFFHLRTQKAVDEDSFDPDLEVMGLEDNRQSYFKTFRGLGLNRQQIDRHLESRGSKPLSGLSSWEIKQVVQHFLSAEAAF